MVVDPLTSAPNQQFGPRDLTIRLRSGPQLPKKRDEVKISITLLALSALLSVILGVLGIIALQERRPRPAFWWIALLLLGCLLGFAAANGR